MMKKIINLLIICIATVCFSNLFFIDTAKADDSVPANYISITQNPSKTTYARGENLDFSDMVLTGYFSDGTIKAITDYTIEGYNSEQLGPQTVYIHYQNFYAVVSITVIPAKVTNITEVNSSTTGFTLTWDAKPDIQRYDIYSVDITSGNLILVTSAYTNSVAITGLPGMVYNYKICAVANIYGFEYRSDMSDMFTAATNPEAVTGLTITTTTTSTASLTWNAVTSATGYIIYRSTDPQGNFTIVGTATTPNFTDSKLSSGQGYTYKVCAYTLRESIQGISSDILQTSTHPAKVNLKYKSGDQKVRLTFASVTGATSYDIYQGDASNGFTLLKSMKGTSSTFTYIVEGLTTGNTYSFYAVARRVFNGANYDSDASTLQVVQINPVQATSTDAKIFLTKTDFMASLSFTNIIFFRKNVNYTKSFVIPGLITTNVGGFNSTAMCPQGITFAKDYLLITAYDIANEENSVIYVMDKKSKMLITTLVLSNKSHVGGITYDGTNLWIPNGSRISAIPFTVIEAAIATGEPYAYIKYGTTYTIDVNPSYVTYYDGKLWVGSYNELATTRMYSYTIEDIDTKPVLTKADTLIIPTRVQGIAFTSKGELIFSRSCQLYVGLRGYMRQLDIYKPDFTIDENGIVPLGNIVNTVEMPSMNEGIAIDGSYLYVNYESGAFANSSYKMDRICAFKLTSIVKKTT